MAAQERDGHGVEHAPPASDLPPPVAAMWPELASQLAPPWGELPTRAVKAGAAAAPSGRVWKLSFANAPPLGLKLASPSAPVSLEAQVLALLGRQHCPVPQLLALSRMAPPAWIALEWCGDLTLDGVAQSTPKRGLARPGQRLAAAMASVEAVFAPLDARWQQGQAQGARAADRAAALRRQADDWLTEAPAALAWLTGSGLDRTRAGALADALGLATSSRPTLGSLDYHARNVVLDGERLTLIDFAAVGADWPERRFVQYGTATGAGLAAGRFASVVTSSSAAAYARAVAPLRGTSAAEVRRCVDAHDVLLLLTAAHHLRMIESGEAHPDRAAAWADVPRRRAQLLTLLQRRLAPDGPAEALRTQLRQH